MPTNYQLLTLISNKFQISEDLQQEIYKRLLKNIQKGIIYKGMIYQTSYDMLDGEIMWGKYHLVKELKDLQKRTGFTIDQLDRFQYSIIPRELLTDGNIKEIWDDYHRMVDEEYILSVEDHELLYPDKIDRINYQLGNIRLPTMKEKNINGIKLKIFKHWDGDCIISMDKHTKKELFDKLDKAGIPYKKNLKKKYLYELLGIPQSWSENQ